MAENTNVSVKEERASFIPFKNFGARFKESQDGNGIVLLIDMDDFLINMADKQQEMLDRHEFKNGVRFKTKTIKMLEQLRHNCRYLISEVEKECKKAAAANAIPDFSCFPTFSNYKFDINDPNRYENAIKHAQYFFDVADILYNQFFEERDVCLEIDNLYKGHTITFDLDKEHQQIAMCKSLIDANRESFRAISEFCLAEGTRLSAEAQSNNENGNLTRPDYGPLVSMDSNDVLKKGDLELTDEVKLAKYKEHVLYEKPIELLQNCVDNLDDMDDIVTNEAVFSMESEEVIDFDAIYNIENINLDAVDFILDLLKWAPVAEVPILGVFIDTHYTGEREGNSKIKLAKKVFPDIDGMLVQFFHQYKHNVVRRGRWSKVEFALEVLARVFGEGVITADMLHLSDDSSDNTKDCNNRDGLSTHYKPQTDTEIINGKIEGSLINYNNEDDTVYFRMTKFDTYAMVTTLYMLYERYCKIKKQGIPYRKEIRPRRRGTQFDRIRGE